jgi:hypothetical protein
MMSCASFVLLPKILKSHESVTRMEPVTMLKMNVTYYAIVCDLNRKLVR